MNQFHTVMLEAVRLLRARVLFWVSLGLSALAALAYLSIGFDENGMTVLFGLFKFEMSVATEGSPGAELLYLGIFRSFIVGFWLTWAAMIMALISYSPVFPEFMEEGSAGVTLSKPISRQKLFLYKFLGGLIFMAVQVGLFALIVFFAVRLRLGEWNPTILWAIPVVLLVFSYLLAVMVWLGIKTRSVVASLLLTLLFWFVCFGVQLAESSTYMPAEHGTGLMGEPLDEDEQANWARYHRIARIPYTILPKPGDTTALLDQWIVLDEGRNIGTSAVDARTNDGGFNTRQTDAMKDDVERRSPLFIIGTSLLFELVVLGFAMRSFCRRDF